MKKILIFQDDFPPYEYGGAGVISGLVARGLASAGYDVFVVSSVQNKKFAGRSLENGMTIFRIYSKYHERWRSYKSLYNWDTIPEIKKIMDEVKPDIVHAHNIHYHLSYHSLKIAREYTNKVFLTTHDIMSFYQGTFTEFINQKDLSCLDHFNYKVFPMMLLRAFKKRYNPFHNTIVRYYFSYVKKIIAVSDSLKDALNQNGIKNVEVIHNGVDTHNWGIQYKELEEFKNLHSLKDSDVVFFGGRLSGAKGGDLILQAMELIIKVHPNTKLLVAGRADHYVEKMVLRAKNLGIKNNIVFVGWLKEKEIKKAYAISSVVVIPSVCFDSFPNGNLEAFVNKKSVVSTCFGGSREIVKDGKNGFIVNPFDIKKLAEKIIYILKNSEKAKEFGENGHRLVLAKYNLNIMIEKYLSLFRE